MRNNALLGALLVVAASGCYPYVHSPPARMVPLEAAKALPKGDFAVHGALAGGAASFGPVVGAGTLQGRYGFGHGLEGALEVGFATLGARNTDWDTNASHSLFSGRTGFKYEAASWFAILAGFGGGVSAAGGYISPDAGLVFSYQGDKVVPFLGGGFYYSHPINAKPIVFMDDDGVTALIPANTIGGYTNLGFRIPVTGSKNDGPRSAIIFAYRLILATFDDEYGRITQLYHLGVLSFDIVARKRQRPAGSSGRRYEIH